MVKGVGLSEGVVSTKKDKATMFGSNWGLVDDEVSAVGLRLG